MANFGAVSALAEEMATEGSRLKKRARIAEEITKVHSSDDQDTALFCLSLAGLPFAASDPRKLNAGGALLSKAILAVSQATQHELTVAYRRHGDMGSAACDVFRDHAIGGQGVTLREVAEAFASMAIAKTTAIRARLVEDLLRQGTALDSKYLLKLMLGDMRIGVKESLVEEGIAVAAGVDVAQVRHAVMLEADLGHAAQRAFAGTLAEARMRLFHPLGFMLASPVESAQEAVERFTEKPPKPAPVKKGKRKKAGSAEAPNDVPDEAMVEALANDVEAAMYEEEALTSSIDGIDGTQTTVQAFMEDKYDGMRAQLHCGAADAAGRVALYSRNRDDITESFPELVEAFCAVTTADGAGLILDGEILGWDYAASQALPFAVLGQRIGRKKVDNGMRAQVPVVFMAFDLMFADGELQLHKPLRERRNRLEQLAEALIEITVSPIVLSESAAKRKHAQGFMFEQDDQTERVPRLMLSPAMLVRDAGEIDRAYAEARARANEGVMLKAANSTYLPGRRGLAWVKLKRVLDTLDVVITGAEYGSGRKSQFLSDYTFAVRDHDGALKNVGKAYSGVTDAEITQLTDFLKAHTLEDHGHFRTVEPLVILEVAFNNIMRSTRHASGFALRFPRILRIRTDKPLEEIDTVRRVEEIYLSQVDRPVEA